MLLGGVYSYSASVNRKHRMKPEKEAEVVETKRTNATDKEDPYANLPPDDEPTDCSMCQTFRQGPCRDLWRKLEHCFKDHEGNDVGQHCLDYFRPHSECIGNYLNLYKLIGLPMEQDIVSDIELAISDEERKEWNPVVDFGIWKEFIKDAGPDFCETVRGKHDKDPYPMVTLGPEEPKGTVPEDPNHPLNLLPLWKRVPENKEPVTVTLNVNLPTESKEGKILKFGYALDQDGLLLGWKSNRGFGKLMDLAAKKESEGDDPMPSKDEDEEDSSPVKLLDITVLPGDTKTIQICGFYSESPVDSDKEILDVTLYKSPRHDLREIGTDRK